MQRERANFDVLDRIEKERIKRNWTEYQLAKNADITQSTISTWYRRSLQPSIASIEKITKGLGISLAQFFADEDSVDFLTPDQHELFCLWERLNNEQRSALLNLLRSFTA